MIRTSHIALLTLAGLATAATADVVTDWNALALQQVKDTRTGPPPTTRILAMMHGAMYNAVNGATGASGQYGGAPVAAGSVIKDVAAAKAARDVLAVVWPDRAGTFDAALAQTTARFAGNAALGSSLGFGAAQASHILTMRANDGSTAPYAYTPKGGVGPYGNYAFTGSSQTTARFNQFATTTTWCLTSASEYRPAPPPTVGSVQYAQEFAQVKALGSATSTVRTAEQTQIASFWAAGAGTVTPPGMWNQIASGITTDRELTIEASSKLFATLNMGLADAAIAAWDAKTHYDNWRPVTGIRQAGLDGNDATEADATWTALLATPEFQSYVSGHSTFSATGATILASVFGDSLHFTVSDDLGNTREFCSLMDAANEAGMSRIYGGIHWMSDNTAGLALGQMVGLAAVANIPAPGAAALLGLTGLIAARRKR
jgi:membrane-associated phospholipid phosphatase